MTNFKQGTTLYYLPNDINGVGRVIPTTSEFANMKVAKVYADGSFRAIAWDLDDKVTYWGYVKHGDFSTEAVLFTSEGLAVKEDKKERNVIRENFGGVPVAQ